MITENQDKKAAAPGNQPADPSICPKCGGVRDYIGRTGRWKCHRCSQVDVLDAITKNADLRDDGDLLKGVPDLTPDDRLERGGFPLRHIRAGIAGMPDLQRSAFEKMRDKVVPGGALILMVGNRGTGKTQLATEVARAVDGSRKYAKALTFFVEVKSTYQSGSAKTQADIIADYVRPHLLVLDEMHVRGETAWETTLLTHLIDLRYDDPRKSTILITNQTVAQASSQLGASIVSRAEETGGLVKCQWDSFRGKGVPAGNS